MTMIQVIYTSAATRDFEREELSNLLRQSRLYNTRMGVTGILLHSQGSFFQVLEGEQEVVDDLLAHIARDSRHGNLTIIIREPISRRSFGDWTMGFAEIEPHEVNTIVGLNDFFGDANFFAQLDSGRAKKLLSAFKEGRWRSKLTDLPSQVTALSEPSSEPQTARLSPSPKISFAYQPIVDIENQRIIAYEALLRGANNESARQVFQKVNPSEIHLFDNECRVVAIELAMRLGLDVHLHLNFLPLSLETIETPIHSTLEAASRFHIQPAQIILEIVESEIIHDLGYFIRAVNAHRESGLKIAIDDFGAGYAGLSLLAEFQPEIVKLDMKLVRDIDSKGPRQAIVRGVIRVCADLGIDVIAEGVETLTEYAWLRDEGITLFQGNLFAAPTFEQLPPVLFPEV
jgi:blue light- and temperature-responsive anti-repressor